MADDARLLRVLTALGERTPAAAGPRVVAIDGRSGAGKTTFARSVAAALGGAPVVALEELYGGWDGLADGALRLVTDVLAPLSSTGRARVPRYDWHAAAWSSPALLDHPADVVVEGVGAGSRRAAPYTTLLVWLELPGPERRRRALARDAGAFDAHWARWAAQEEAYLRAEDPVGRADLVLPMA